MSAGRGWLDRVRVHSPDREAFVFDGGSVAYGQLVRAVRIVARELGRSGLEPGDLIAVLAPPTAAGVLLIHAAFEAGVAMLPLNIRLSERELRDAMIRTGVRFLFVEASMDPALAMRLSESAPCGLVVFSESKSGPEGAPGFAFELRRAPEGEDRASLARARRDRRSRRVALVLQTSGTSGRARAAQLGLDNLIASAEASSELLGRSAHDRWLLCMPLFHVGGLSILVRSALDGVSFVLHRRFDAKQVAAAIDDEGVTRISVVPTMLERLLEARGSRRAPDALSLVLVGGGPASSALLTRARALGYPIAPTYGLTEAASQVATRPPGAGPADGVDSGGGLEPLPGVEIRIVDGRGRPLPPGREGGIEVAGPIVMKGYLGDPEATARTLVGRWLRTGDIGMLDRRGRLRVLDRRADLILSGGENIYPAEIESVLAGHPAVAECGVIGRPDPVFGARPIAFVVLLPGKSFDPAGFEAFCRERMAGYKVPDAFIEIADLPRTASGKLARRRLRDQLGVGSRSRA